MRWHFCIVLLPTAHAWTRGIPSHEPAGMQEHRERVEQLPAARPAEATEEEVQQQQQAAEWGNRNKDKPCTDPWWCRPGQKRVERPPKQVTPAQTGSGTAPKGAKNVLLIVVDDMRTQLNTAYNHPFMITPSIDKLAQSSGAVVFSRAYAQAAHCAPSRNSFMSGRYPDSLKVYNVHGDFRLASTPDNPIIPIPQHFKENGYLSFGGGKVYHPNHPAHNDKPHSWSEGTVKGGVFKYFDDPDHGCPDGHGGNPNIHGEGTEAHKGGCAGCPEDKPVTEFYDGRLANWTIRALRLAHEDQNHVNGEKKPFFIATGFRRPHTPWNVAQRFVDMYSGVDDAPKHREWARGAPQCAFACGGDGVGCDFSISQPRELEATKLCRRTYYASVTATDFYIGQVLDELERLEMAEDTAVVLFGDHGWHLGENGLWAKYTNTELSTRVPLIIRAPWLASTQGHRNSQGIIHSGAFVELVDIYPTLVELVGLPKPKGLEGRSIMPVLAKPHSWDGERHTRDYAQSQFAHCCQGGEADANRQCGACEQKAPEQISYMGYAVRNSMYRLVTWYKWDGSAALPHCNGLIAVELYNHVGDRGVEASSFDDFEQINLAANLSLGEALSPHEKRMADMMRREMRRELRAEIMGDELPEERIGRLRVNGNKSNPSIWNADDDMAYQRWKANTDRPHASAIKYMHHDLLRKFATAFARCVPAVAVQQHRRAGWAHAHIKPRDEGNAAQGEQQAMVIDPSLNDIHSEPGDWPDLTTSPDPE